MPLPQVGTAAVYFLHGKILSTDVSADDAYRRRFTGDVDVARPLAHPNMVCVSDRGESNRQLWISMDLVDGTDAATLLRDR
jgi:serine/threonine-protein kinase